MAKNAGKPWSIKDRNRCKYCHNNGLDIAQIAERLGRTHFAIECQLKALGLEPHSGDMSARAFNSEETAILKERIEEPLTVGCKMFISIPKLNEEKCTMKMLTTVTYVNGKDVEECNHEEIIQAIRNIRDDMASLKDMYVVTKSTKMAEQIKEYEEDILALVKIYDNI